MKTDRRGFFSVLGAASAGLVLAGASNAQTQSGGSGNSGAPPLIDNNDPRVKKLIEASRVRLRDKFFPNVELTTHEGKKVRFYDDLIKDKIVTLNFMYATCDGICPGITRNLAKAQELLGDMVGRDIFMYSISLKPLEDTPAVLGNHARALKVKPGWLFLTGKPEDIELIRQRQGFVDPDPAVDKDKDQHIGNVRFGNEPMQYWGACPGLGKPEIIVESLLWMDEGLRAKYEAQKEKMEKAGPQGPETEHHHHVENKKGGGK
jgi:protein SCO1